MQKDNNIREGERKAHWQQKTRQNRDAQTSNRKNVTLVDNIRHERKGAQQEVHTRKKTCTYRGILESKSNRQQILD